MTKKKNIKIIGGGISGLSMALGLQMKGINYEIHEQNHQITYENVGLGISANIFPILEEWNLLDETKKIGAEIKHFYFVDKNINYINSFVMKNPALSVNRKLFYKLFLENLDPEKVFLNSRRTTDSFTENSLVISADGIHSETRKAIYPKIKLRDSNQTLWRGITKIQLDDKFRNAYHDFVGDNLRFAIIHTGQDYYSWYAIKEKEIEDKNIDKQNLMSYFKDYHPVINEIIKKSEDFYIAEMFDINPKDRKNLDWFLKNNLMIGDAIHATTPNMANGACLAIESSYVLTNLLANRTIPLTTVFKEFQKSRTKKINPIVNQSWLLGKTLHQKNSIINFLIKIGLKTTPNFLFNNIYSKILIEPKK